MTVVVKAKSGWWSLPSTLEYLKSQVVKATKPPCDEGVWKSGLSPERENIMLPVSSAYLWLSKHLYLAH